MDKRAIERLIPTLIHLILLAASLHFIISMMYYRQMPRIAVWMALPNLLLLIWFWRRSPYIRDHAAQATGWHVMLLSLGALPYISRLPALVSESWLKPAVHGAETMGMTPDYSLLVLLVILLAFAFPAAAVDGVFRAAQRQVYQYPLVGRLLPRPTFPDSDYIWTP